MPNNEQNIEKESMQLLLAMAKDLIAHVEQLERTIIQQNNEISELKVSLAMVKHPELAIQNPIVAQQIEQNEQNVISSMNSKIEVENMFKNK